MACQADPCRCLCRLPGLPAVASDGNIAAVLVPVAVPMLRPGAVEVPPCPTFRETLCSSWASSDLREVAVVGATGLTCSVLWGGSGSLDTWTCIRSEGLVQTLGLRVHRPIPSRGHNLGHGSPAAVMQRSGPKVRARVAETAGIANKGTDEPILRLLAEVHLLPFRQIRPEPLVVVCRLAAKLAECRARFAFAQVAASLAAFFLPPASFSPPRLWRRDKPAWTPQTRAAKKGRLETAHTPGFVEVAAEDGLGMNLMMEVAVAAAVVVQNFEEVLEKVSSPPEVASHGEAQTLAG